MDRATGLEMESSAEPQLLVEWYAEHYKEFGCTLEFVSDRSQEGAQFVRGFGAVGAILRYKVDFATLETVDDNDSDEFYDSDDSDM